MNIAIEVFLSLGMAIAGYYIKRLDDNIVKTSDAIGKVETSIEVQTEFNRQMTRSLEKMDKRVSQLEKSSHNNELEIAVLKGKYD